MDQAVHAVGNGRLFVAFAGADVYRYQPVDGALLFAAKLTDAAGKSVPSTHVREKGKMLYRYTLDCGTMTDYVTDADCWVREFDLTAPLMLTIEPSKLCDGNCVKKGTFFINDYPTAVDAYYTVFGEGIAQDGNKITMTGKGRLVVKLSEVPNPDRTVGTLYSPVYSGLKGDYSPEVRAADEEFFFICQSYRCVETGGYASAVEWNLCYVRDSFGMCRGHLAAGRYREARDWLRFNYDGFVKNGYIATAYSFDGLYTPHRHECDRAENTGLIVLLADMYRRTTGDEAFFQSIMPMLTWCMHAQAEVCVGGMLPFSGDETFVAGNILPRVCLDDGSSESTMLFIECARRMAPYMPNDPSLKTAEEARKKFRDNFVRDGSLITNNPARRDMAPLPEKKHGCCLGCYAFTDLYPDRYGIYRCANCVDRADKDLRDGNIYKLPCVAMEPAFFGSDLLTEEENRAYLESVARTVFAQTNDTSVKSTGYEAGLLLYGLTATNSPLAETAYKRTLAMRDEEGVWAEYYFGNTPSGMRWRVWEPGVNLCALIAYEDARRKK